MRGGVHMNVKIKRLEKTIRSLIARSAPPNLVAKAYIKLEKLKENLITCEFNGNHYKNDDDATIMELTPIRVDVGPLHDITPEILTQCGFSEESITEAFNGSIKRYK
jgi:hypothetical protein